MIWAYINNKFILKEEVSISPFDRGFLFGDSIYEVIPVYNNIPFLLSEHLERLEENLKKVGIEGRLPSYELTEILHQLIERNKLKEQVLYIQISRGVDPIRSHLPKTPNNSTLFIYSSELDLNPYRDKAYERGLNVRTTQDIRWDRSDIKTTSLMANVLAISGAHSENFHEVLMHKDGLVTEAAKGSLLFVIGDKVVIPMLSNKVLNSITRNFVIGLLKKLSLKIEERDIYLEEIFDAREVWYLSSTKEIQPINSINNVKVNYDETNLLWSKVLDKYVTHLGV